MWVFSRVDSLIFCADYLQQINHPNIVRLYDVIETDKYIGIVLEYASGGELFDHILAHRFLRERDACKLFAQLISGVSYIHQKKIVHRDLKLENLLLDRNRNVIITDFGFANRFEHRPDDLMQTSCGSPCYAAPELVISEGEYVGSAVDIWSCGVILYAMLAGYLPFDDDPANPDGDNINLLYKYIVTTPLTFPDYVSESARDLLGRMLVPDPKHRADLATIMAHPWLAPYSAQFQLSVEQLEQQAIEQQQAKRMAYQRQVRKKQQQQAQAAQTAAQTRATRTQSTRPAAADESSDLLYTSAASTSRRDRAGASAIVLPSPAAADTDMLNVDDAQTKDPASAERKSKGYRHTIQLEYDVATREIAPPVPSTPQPPVPLPPADVPSPYKVPPDISFKETAPAPKKTRSSGNVRSASASHTAPPSAFGIPASVRSASTSNAEARLRGEDSDVHAISTDAGRDTAGRLPLMDAKTRSTDHSTREDGTHSAASVGDVPVPSVHVSVPPISPVTEADILAALSGGRAGSSRIPSGTSGTLPFTLATDVLLTLCAGAHEAREGLHGPSVRVEGLPNTEVVRSPVMLTPTTTESGIPTPVVTEPAGSDVEGRSRHVNQSKSAESATPAQAKTLEDAQVRLSENLKCGY